MVLFFYAMLQCFKALRFNALTRQCASPGGSAHSVFRPGPAYRPLSSMGAAPGDFNGTMGATTCRCLRKWELRRFVHSPYIGAAAHPLKKSMGAARALLTKNRSCAIYLYLYFPFYYTTLSHFCQENSGGRNKKEQAPIGTYPSNFMDLDQPSDFADLAAFSALAASRAAAFSAFSVSSASYFATATSRLKAGLVLVSFL